MRSRLPIGAPGPRRSLTAGLAGLLACLGTSCLAAPPVDQPAMLLSTATPSPSPSPARPVLQPPASPSPAPLTAGRIPVAAPSPLALAEAEAITHYFDSPHPGVASLTIADIDRLSPPSPRPEDRRRVFLVTLNAQLAADETSAWEAGRNLRWVALLRGSDGGWQVGAVATEPLPPAE